LLQHVKDADTYLSVAVIVLTTLACLQLRAFARPPPLPPKRLPRRPVVSISFRPDEIRTTNSVVSTIRAETLIKEVVPPVRQSGSHVWKQFHGTNKNLETSRTDDDYRYLSKALDLNSSDVGLKSRETSTKHQTTMGAIPLGANEDRSRDGEDSGDDDTEEPSSQFRFVWPGHDDLPDSFAPLLSSSTMELLTKTTSIELVHALKFEGSIRLRPGSHEVPLNIDRSRPQLRFDIPLVPSVEDRTIPSENGDAESVGSLNSPGLATTAVKSTSGVGCRMTVVARLGSDSLDVSADWDVATMTSARSSPMVKDASVAFDPPLALSNVAPTLIHFPTLFEDNYVHSTLRRVQLIRILIDLISISSQFLEKVLWIIESQCQIHLSHISVKPVYKGKKKATSTVTTRVNSFNVKAEVTPEWHLPLAFSGHAVLFGFIPIPFVSVVLPTFIIPQPHALLTKLLSQNPLASTRRIHREKLAEPRIAIALINSISHFSTEFQILATPPAIDVDVTLPGGVNIAAEVKMGRDPGTGRSRSHNPVLQQSNEAGTTLPVTSSVDNASLSSWTTGFPEPSGAFVSRVKHKSAEKVDDSIGMHRNRFAAAEYTYDSNHEVPWLVDFSAKGSVGREKLSVLILKCVLRQGEKSESQGTNMIFHLRDSTMRSRTASFFAGRGSFAIWRLHSSNYNEVEQQRQLSTQHSLPLNASSDDDAPSVATIFLFPEEASSGTLRQRILRYDYTFDVLEETRLDAVSVCVRATHPMLNGGTVISVILESSYAFGSLAARESDAILDPTERQRKRNILRHLPATDVTFGIQNIFIPPESESYSDDGQTLFIPELKGGRMQIRLIGGLPRECMPRGLITRRESSVPSNSTLEGIKLIVDFDIASLVLRTVGHVKEFPEIEVFEGMKLKTNLVGLILGSVRVHLRPQKLSTTATSTGPNIFNPLEAHEIDFSGSSLSMKVKEYSATLGHRRIMIPTESSFVVDILESIVDMTFDGKTSCELGWDFQGLSPVLQVTEVGGSVTEASPEQRQQVGLLISPLRQGRVSFRVSSVGGISIQGALTSRTDKEGLYDWKFFNALVNPDVESVERMFKVLQDDRTMRKLLQILKLINNDMHNVAAYLHKQILRIKQILDRESIREPSDAIPLRKLTRLVTRLVTNDVEQVETFLPIVKRIIDGNGLDVVRTKEHLQQHLSFYDNWAPEIDRVVRMVAMLLAPVASTQPFVDPKTTPLSEVEHYNSMFSEIPSASAIYDHLADKPKLPLEASFSNLVGRVAPYLTFDQIEYILEARDSSDWQPADLRRLRYVYSIKRKVMDIAESYGGMSFLPQSFMVSVFLGEATRSSLRASYGLCNEIELLRKGVDAKYIERLAPPLGVASLLWKNHDSPKNGIPTTVETIETRTAIGYDLGDSLLGPSDVAILLQAGLTSVMKSSTVVQLNQRMLLDLMCSQPTSFAVAVLAEIGSAGGSPSPRSLTGALMALLELDQTAFRIRHRINVHGLLESWIPGLKIPKRDDYMAGGRWARQSYYEALFSVAGSVLEDAEVYFALKGHLQRVRSHKESDPLPGVDEHRLQQSESTSLESLPSLTRLQQSTILAQQSIDRADLMGVKVLNNLLANERKTENSDEFRKCIQLYRDAFRECAKTQSIDKHAFHLPWFSEFYCRNYDALMILSMFENVRDDVGKTRLW
jgi:hypothetical protein